MCGRFVQSIPLGKLTKIGLYDEFAGEFTESYNLAPSQQALVLYSSGGEEGT